MKNEDQRTGRIFRKEPVSAEILAAASRMANATCAKLANSHGFVLLHVETPSVRLLSTESMIALLGEQNQGARDEVVEVSWVSWSHSGSFESNLLEGLSANIDRVTVAVEVLLAVETFSRGTELDYAFLGADMDVIASDEPPEEVLKALAQQLKEAWAQDLIEWAEGDPDFFRDWPPTLRETAEQILQEESNRPAAPDPTCPFCGSPARDTVLFRICTNPSCRKKSIRGGVPE